MHQILVLSEEKEFFGEVQRKYFSSKQVTFLVEQSCIELLDDLLGSYFDLVLLDIDIPGERIMKLLKVMKTLRPQLKIILLTSPERMEQCLQALSAGVVSYLMKPLAMDELAHIIRSTLNISQNKTNKEVLK